MTPEERKLITDLFDRLAALEDAERDPEAERAIRDDLRQAPNAIYPLVQSVLVQDEALKAADARIRELEAELGIGQPPQQRETGFLGSMREALLGRQEPPRGGSVPSVRSGESQMGVPPGYQGQYRTEAQPMPPGGPPPAAGGAGGSFLGTAAAAAAGMIGGSLLMDSFRGMTGGKHGSGAGGTDRAQSATGEGASPWGGSNSGGELGRQAGADDIGRGTGGRGDFSEGRGQGVFDNASNEAKSDQQDGDQGYAAEDADFEDVDDGDDGDDGDFDFGDDNA